MDILDKDAQKLELDKILSRLLALCNNGISRETVETLEPSLDPEELEEVYRETGEGKEIRRLNLPCPVFNFPEIRPLLKRVEMGGVLEPEELKDIRIALEVLRDTVAASGHWEDQPLLGERASFLREAPALLVALIRSVDEEGRIPDGASKTLESIRRTRAVLNGRIRSRLEALLNSEAGAKYLQDRLVTIRSDRYVVPVKAEYRGKIPGLIHDQSASGATVYVEPEFAVEMNNQLKQLVLDKAEEIRRILRELSRAVAGEAAGIRKNLYILGQLDLVMARARLSQEMDASTPELNRQGEVLLLGARHPLLTGKVVANDLEIGTDFRTVIITGPNTGGKTIALKTLGLLCLMARLGLDLPCEPGSRVALFPRIFADIGDEQSIEQSLSTYSAHMTNIIRILDSLEPGCLVLLDELGAGTDPMEGAALAVSLLEHLHGSGACTMATTHYGELKAFAYSHPGVINASVEFDNNTLRPTYRLLMGTPGLSNALVIAGKLGLSDSVIARAREHISGEELQISAMLADLEEKRLEAGRMRQEADRLRQEVDFLRSQLEEKELQLGEKERLTMEKAYAKAEEVIRQAQLEAEELIRSLREGLSGSDRPAQLQTSNEAREVLKASREKIREGREKFSGRRKKALRELTLGETVYVGSLGQKGQVLSLPDARGEVSVQVGIMKINVSLEDLTRAEAEEKQVSRSRYASLAAGKSRMISPEVDLRGMTGDEAIEALDKYVDDGVLAGLEQIRIIHGKGTGALRKAVQEYLKASRRIRSYREGESGEGGSGVTVALLKK